MFSKSLICTNQFVRQLKQRILFKRFAHSAGRRDSDAYEGGQRLELAQAWGVFTGCVKCVGGDLGDEVRSFACVLAWLLLIVCNEVHRQVAP